MRTETATSDARHVSRVFQLASDHCEPALWEDYGVHQIGDYPTAEELGRIAGAGRYLVFPEPGRDGPPLQASWGRVGEYVVVEQSRFAFLWRQSSRFAFLWRQSS